MMATWWMRASSMVMPQRAADAGLLATLRARGRDEDDFDAGVAFARARTRGVEHGQRRACGLGGDLGSAGLTQGLGDDGCLGGVARRGIAASDVDHGEQRELRV